MTYENLLYGIEERVCTITLNRPEKMNALSWPLRQEFLDALKKAERDNDVGCIVVKGAGRAFSAGYDMTPSNPPSKCPEATDTCLKTSISSRDSTRGTWSTPGGQIWELTKPVIAQVHGWCLAGASELASMCDLMFVAEDAQLRISAGQGNGGAGPDLLSMEDADEPGEVSHANRQGGDRNRGR